MTEPELRDAASVAAIVAEYNESTESVERTLVGILEQSVQPAQVVLVDDASPVPPTLSPQLEPRVEVIGLPENGGVSVARNRGVQATSADYLLFVNCDVVLHSDWVKRALAFMDQRPEVGAVSGTIVPKVGTRVVRDWRLHFIETKEHRLSLDEPTPVSWIVGHVFFVRKRAFDRVGGFDPLLWLRGEDWAFSQALLEAGYGIYHLPELVAESYEPASVKLMAWKSVRNAGWDVWARNDRPSAECRPVRPLATSLSVLSMLSNHMARNLARRRFSLVPVDLAVAMWSLALVWRVSIRTLRA